MANTRNANLDDQKRRAYNATKNQLKNKYQYYQNLVKENETDIEACETLIANASSIIESLAVVSQLLSSVGTAVSYGLIVSGKPAVTTDSYIGKVNEKVSTLEDFIAAVKAEQVTLENEHQLNNRLYGQYYSQWANLSLSDF